MANKAISSEVIASSITSVVGIAGIFGAIAAGYIVARIRRSKPVYVIPVIIFGLALLGFIWAQGTVLIVLISLIVGLASYMLATMMFAIPPQLVSPELTGTAIGVAVVFFNLAGVFGPIIIGNAYAFSGTLLIPGVTMFVCLVVAAIVVQTMKIR
ncbi:MAG: MFS transporter [Candidatus Micrarchaeaceae archaeon]